MKFERVSQRSNGLSDRVVAMLRHRHAAFVILAVLVPAMVLIPITHDAIWQVWIGRHLLAGEQLYIDIIEVNPPLWFWIAIPLAATGLEPRLAIIAFFVSSIALSLFLSPDRYRLLVLAALVGLPLIDFGQREHFTLIATVPYVFLIARRASGETVEHPVIIAAFAAVGFALKPYFALVPLGLEFMVRQRLRPETVTLGLCAVAYAVAVPVFTPEYLTVIVPMLRQAYGAFGGGSSVIIAVLTFAAAAVGLWLGRRKGTVTTRTLLLAAAAFFIPAIIQAKGWSYQTVPARGFLFLALALELVRERRRPIADAFIFGALLTAWLPFGVYANRFAVEAERHMDGIPPGSSVIAVVNNPSQVWPTVDDRHLDWQLKAFSVWPMQAMLSSPDQRPIAAGIVNAGLARNPDVLIIDRRPPFRRIARSLVPDAYLDGYRLRLRTEDMESYIRKGFRP